MLVVEDYADTGESYVRLFRAAGWDVRTVATLAEAMKELDDPPDCMTLDLKMRDGDGEGLLRLMRDRGMATRVVVISGVNDLARFGRIQEEYQPVAVYLKPADPAEVLAACERVKPSE
jgi:DNA-binding response OmpR family regulator